ncbi:hypothetical protein HY500_04345 [Candidatus Woesearchaeota archaeon]|nr:hypothetical protein [Candidatus Woesearchaeota archaeon]
MPVYPKFISKKELQKIIQNNYIGFEKIIKWDKQDFFGSSPPTIFIGSKLSYPKVNVGILSPPEETEDAWIHDAQTFWPQTDFTINDIIRLRSALINSRFTTNVKAFKSGSKFLDIAQEIGIGSKPVDIEVYLKKKPNLTTSFDNVRLPMGPSVGLEKVKITENVKVNPKVEKVISDTDFKANEASYYLFNKGIDEHAISQLLTIGVLGLKKNRKLVPTRFSITATDDNIGKNIINEIKGYNPIEDFRIYEGNYFGNYYYILMFPGVFNYELFEGYMPRSSWNPNSEEIKWATDSETHFGRKTYASNCVGGYYAARLPILQFLKQMKRQASVLVIRFETEEYYAALGVWVVRSAARKTLSNKERTFDSKENMLKYLKAVIYGKFNYDLNIILKRSIMINSILKQKNLYQFV